MIGPQIIVMTGIDGSGKTTQAKLLVNRLREAGVDATYEHSIGPNFRVVRWLKDRIAQQTLKKEDEMVNESSSGSPRRMLGLFFLWRGIWQAWVNKLSHLKTDVVVLDRYLYDDLVRVMWKYEYPLPYVRLLLLTVPSPSVVFCLEAPSEIAWQRESDGQTTKSEHEIKKKCYDSVMEEVTRRRPVTRIDTDKLNIHMSHSKIVKKINESLYLNI